MIWYILGIFSGVWLAQTFQTLPRIQDFFNKALDASKNDKIQEVFKTWGTNITSDFNKKE
jgi:hypothetical protein